MLPWNMCGEPAARSPPGAAGEHGRRVLLRTEVSARSCDRWNIGRRANAMQQQLGASVYTERTGHGTADSQAKIDKQMSDISAYEQENGLNLTGQ
jgi:hypothetical protein